MFEVSLTLMTEFIVLIPSLTAIILLFNILHDLLFTE